MAMTKGKSQRKKGASKARTKAKSKAKNKPDTPKDTSRRRKPKQQQRPGAETRAGGGKSGGGTGDGGGGGGGGLYRSPRSDGKRDEDFFIDLVYRKVPSACRHTQDSPILPDVFVHFGTQPQKKSDLLLTPNRSRTPAAVAKELRKRLYGAQAESKKPAAEESKQQHDIVYNNSVVAAELTFEELICCVLPMSGWWHNRLMAVPGADPAQCYAQNKFASIMRLELRRAVDLELRRDANPISERVATHGLIHQDMAWAARLFWLIQHSNLRRGSATGGEPFNEPEDAEKITDYFLKLLALTHERSKQTSPAELDRGRVIAPEPWVHSVNRNREVTPTIYNSVVTTKVDAAERTFGVRGQNICWAIIDTGIDARHPAFRKFRDDEPYPTPFGAGGANNTRVRATFDFSSIRRKLAQDDRIRLARGAMLDWAPDEFRVPHTDSEYSPPTLPHGTHVAGILAADWREPEPDPLAPPSAARGTRPLKGLCPDIQLYDLRVFEAGGKSDEFSIMSALQFARHLNQQHERLEIHGVNLSLAMPHEVSNYACGRSPVCEECTRLVGSGVLVVAAAGNAGRSIYTTPQGKREEGYRTVSIADPGNAEAVLTVGSTHSREPHTYGVSYFSSRGPTGDGRAKPDLVAPGEKIESTAPGELRLVQDGTSQAAPHVSGAAALLMSRNNELLGQPARVKQILMDTATDLGRLHDFQGRGLVDVMRALQSV